MEEKKFAYTGSTPKVVITPKATGFDPVNDNWSVEVRCDEVLYKWYKKEDLKYDNGEFFIIINTEGMSGQLQAAVYADIPDADCEGGIRKEICKIDLFPVVKVWHV